MNETVLLPPKRLRPAFKCHGGKFYLSDFLVSNFPDDYRSLNYLEPYCGGASAFLNKDRSPDESLNDLNTGVIRIYRTLRDDSKSFISKLRRVKYNEKTFLRALESVDADDGFEGAANEFILRRMSRGGLKKAFAWSDRERGGQPGDVNAWKTMLDLLPLIAARLKGTHLFNRKAIQVIDTYNDSKVFLYCDPPYLHETRQSIDAYEDEMDEAAHIKLGDKLKQFRGKVMISGYPSDLYKKMFDGWKYTTKNIANHASQQKTKGRKIEAVWMNY